MSITPTFLGAGQMPATIGALYTSPTGVHTVIKKATFTNTSAGAVAFGIHRTASGNTPSLADEIISAQSLSANQCYIAQELGNVVLAPGDSIQGAAASAASITYMLNGYTF